MKEVNFNHRNTYGIQASAQFSAGQWLNGNVFIVGQYIQDKCDDFFDLPFNRSKFSVITGGMASFLLNKQANLRFILNPFFQSNAIQGVYDIKNLFKLNASLRWASADWTSGTLSFRGIILQTADSSSIQTMRIKTFP